MRKPRKNTTTYKEFSSMIKNLVEQKRYYGKRGIDIPDVRDYFTRADASADNLRGLRKFKKQIIDPFIKDIKTRVKAFTSQKNVSASTAYKRLSGLLSGRISAADVTLETFREQYVNLNKSFNPMRLQPKKVGGICQGKRIQISHLYHKAPRRLLHVRHQIYRLQGHKPRLPFPHP